MLRTLSVFLLALVLSIPLAAQYPGAAGCIGFNGTSHYIAVPNAATLNSDTALTLEAWILPNGFNANSYGNVIIGKDGWASGSEGYTLRCGGNGALSFNIGTGSGWVEVVTNNVLYTQTWQHVAGVFDGTTLRIYVNGVQVGSTNYTGTIANGTYDVNLGRIPYTVSGGRFFQGELDEIRIWRTALSETTIRDWMCRKVTPSHPRYNLLGGYWRFDAGSGNILPDHGPNNNSGTLVGGPMWGFSGAAIGDTSVYVYGGPGTLSIPGVNGGNFVLNNISGSPAGVQLYQVKEAPDFVNLPPGFTSFDTSHYYGAMIIAGTSPNFDVTLDYGGNNYIGPNDGCIAAIGGRIANNSAVWYGVTASHQLAQNQLYRATIGPQQFILGRQPQPYPLLALGHVDFCPGDSALLGTTSSGSLTFAWYLNGSPIPGATGASYYATQGGDFHVVVDDGTCAYSTDTVTTSTYAPANIVQTQLGGICHNAGQQNLAAVPPGGSFSGPGVGGTIFDPIVAGSGMAPVVYSYTDSNMCVTRDTQVVTVHPPANVTLPNFPSVCNNAAPFTLSGAQPSGGVYSGTNISGNVFAPNGMSPGNYPVQYDYTDGFGCVYSATGTLPVVAAPPTPTITVASGSFFSSSPTGNQWLLNGQAIPGATGSSYTPTASGTYSVVVTGGNGCVSDTSAGETFVGLLGADPVSWEAWPNPSGGRLQVRWTMEAGADYALSVLDLGGRELIREVGTARRGQEQRVMELGDLAPGVYFLRLQTPEGQGVRKLIRN